MNFCLKIGHFGPINAKTERTAPFDAIEIGNQGQCVSTLVFKAIQISA